MRQYDSRDDDGDGAAPGGGPGLEEIWRKLGRAIATTLIGVRPESGLFFRQPSKNKKQQQTRLQFCFEKVAGMFDYFVYSKTASYFDSDNVAANL